MANGTTQITKPRTARSIGDIVLARRESFAAVLPKHMTVDRFVKVTLAALTKTPKLQECTPESFLMAVAACAELGLEPNSPLGHAYLIPYGKDCQLVIGFKGLLAVARRSGEIGSISVRVVRERDEFTVQYGDNEKIHHVPFRPVVTYDANGNPTGFEGPADGGRAVAAYMIAHLKDGSIQREVMNVDEILLIRARSRSGKSGPWATDFDEMARKTVFRRGWKWLPQSTEMAKVAAYDDDGPSEIGKQHVPLEGAFVMPAPATRSDALAAEIEAQAIPVDGGATHLQEATQDAPPMRQPGDD